MSSVIVGKFRDFYGGGPVSLVARRYHGGGDSDVGNSDIIKLEKGYSDGDVGSSDVSRKGGRDRAGDSDVCRQVGTRRSQYFGFCLFTPRVSDSYYYRTVLEYGDQRTGGVGDLVLAAVAVPWK